jgi:hypothetical protein
VRPSGTPLKGAVITSCIPNATANGYTLTYTLNGAVDSVEYSWTQAGAYTFNYYVSGAKTTSNYKGSAICKVANTSSIHSIFKDENNIQIFPNPTHSIIYIKTSAKDIENDLRQINIYNLKGEKIFTSNKFEPEIDTKSFVPGVYFSLYVFRFFQTTKK